jgi:hypothetical protein
MLATLNDSKSIVECGTSFGVSTIYFALAAQRNAHGIKSESSGVITIEKDGVKVSKAKSVWAEAGQVVEDWITPHEGDLLEVLAKDEVLPPIVDLVFLDGELPSVQPFQQIDTSSMDVSSPALPQAHSTTPTRRFPRLCRQDWSWQLLVSHVPTFHRCFNKILDSDVKDRYQDLLDFVHDPANGFMSMTLPLKEGFEVMVRTPNVAESKDERRVQ